LIGDASHFAIDWSIDHSISDPSVFAILEKILEELAIMHHRSAQIFRRRRISAMTLGDFACRAIVVDHASVVHGEIGGALIEIHDRVSARFHHFLDQLVGARDRASWIVDEHRLDASPPLVEEVALIGEQWTNFQVFDALLSFQQLFFSALLIADFADDA
jgi:hypothetical protein